MSKTTTVASTASKTLDTMGHIGSITTGLASLANLATNLFKGNDKEKYEKEIANLKEEQSRRDAELEKKIQDQIDSISDKEKELERMNELIRIGQEENELKRKEMLAQFENKKNEQLQAQKQEYENLMQQNKEEERQRLGRVSVFVQAKTFKG